MDPRVKPEGDNREFSALRPGPDSAPRGMKRGMLSLPPDSPARRVLREVFGYDDFRPGQDEVIAALIGGTSVLTVMPNSSGQSRCLPGPSLVCECLPLVVSPLVAILEYHVAALLLGGFA